MGQNSKKIIAANAENLRKKNNITREKMSLILGFDNSYISKLEKGSINITIEKLDKIADYFGINTGELLKPQIK